MMEMTDYEYHMIFLAIPSAILAIANIIYRMKGKNIRVLRNIKIRYEIYEKIITEKNKILKYTYLKYYIGFSITNSMAEFILNSAKFYDIITVLKNIYSYIQPNPENGNIKLKKCPEQKKFLFISMYILFLIPAFWVIMSIDKLILCPKYLISAVIMAIPFTIIAIFYFGIEAGNINQAIKTAKSLEEDMKSLENQDTKGVEGKMKNLEARMKSIEERMEDYRRKNPW
jgi:hypothetical protein